MVNIRNPSCVRICKHRGKPSRGRTLGSPAFHFAVVKFFCYLPLVSRGAMAVCVQLDFSLGSPFATSMTRVFTQIVIVILIVMRFLERNKSLHVCRHLETECSGFHQTSPAASKQMISPCVYIQAVTWSWLCHSEPLTEEMYTKACFNKYIVMVIWKFCYF